MSIAEGEARRNWRRVTHSHPCPICKHADWCSLSADGALAKCMRVEEGSWRSGEQKDGARYYLHRLDGAARPAIELPPPAKGTAARRADPATLHAVYDALLGGLTVSAAHRDNLRKRGLSDSEIDLRLYRTLPVQGRARLARELRERWPDDLLAVPGFVVRDKDGRRYPTIAGSAGLLIPVRDLAGCITALKVRRDDAGDGPRYSYLSSVKFGGPSPGSPVHVPLGVAAPAMTVRLTEGELKADAATVLSGVPAVSVPGVAGWKACLPLLRELETKTVLIAFDADAAEKPTVARALNASVEGLVAEGLAIEVEKWDAAHKGIDDALAAGVAVEVLAGDAARAYVAEALALATAGEEPAAPDALDRLGDVLAEGGIEAFFRDVELLRGLAELKITDPGEFACKRALLKRNGCPLRDLDNTLAPFLSEHRRASLPPDAAGQYRIAGGRIVREVLTKDGPVEVALNNFTARIVEQITMDDGAEKSIRLVMEGALMDGTPLPRAEIPANDFGRMEWIVPSWGTQAVVYAGMATKDHLRCAIQLLSGDVPRRIVYGHLGWRKIGEQWVYLHAGGAIGADGPIAGVEVAPPAALARYVLPAPPAGDDLRRAVRASLALLVFGPPCLAFPLLSAVYRSVLGSSDFAVHLMGHTGVYKSEVAALLQQHFGSEMDARHLPASWASTGNALEGIAFACKDALLAVDDFAPNGNAADVARLHREAERLLRAQGNAAGRQRMRADGSLRPEKPPRGQILTTGEDAPRGQSLRARLLILEASKGNFGPPPPDANPSLTERQRDAAEGLYAASVAGYVQWLAPRYDALRGRLLAERAELRDRGAGDGQHARTPGIVADLALGLRYLLDFATEAGAIETARHRELWDTGWRALSEVGALQAEHIESAEPAGHFLRLLSAAVASGRAHLAAPEGQQPDSPQSWGWRREDTNSGPAWRAQGKRVGWVDDGQLYLEPESAFAASQSLAEEQNESLAISPRTLWKRLRERGLLASWDDRRQRNTIRRTLEGVRDREVLHLRAYALYSLKRPSEPSAETENPPKSAEMRTVFADGNGVDQENHPQISSAKTGNRRSADGSDGQKQVRKHPAESNFNRGYTAPGLTEEDIRTPFDEGEI
jgi:hypothetical protein